MDLVPIKVRINRRAAKNGAVNDYPDFNRIAADIHEGMDWSIFIDVFGSGMIYGTVEEGDDLKQYCIMCVPEAFALEAVRLFSPQVEEIDERTLDTWYAAKGPGREQAEDRVDTDALQALRIREELGQDVTALKVKALNPKDDTPGIRENPHKTWARLKAHKNIEIIARLREPGPPV